MRPLGRFETFVVSLVAVGGLWAGSAAAAEPLENSAGSSPRLKYLPKDYWLVAECDVSTVMKVVNNPAAQQNPQYAQFKQAMQLVKTFTSIDPEKDLDWITLFATGTPGEKPTGLIVVQGSFKNNLVEKRLAAAEDSVTKKTYKNHTIYEFSEFAICFPEAATILVGNGDLVQKAIDQLGGKPRPLPMALKSVLDRTPGDRIVWAAARPQVLLDSEELADWRENNGDLHRVLKKIEALSLCFDVSDDGLLIKGLGYVAGAGEAKKLYQDLSDRKKNRLHKEGANVFFTSLLLLSELKTSGPHIEGSFRMTGQAFKELWETKVIVRPGPRSGGSGRSVRRGRESFILSVSVDPVEES